MRTQFLCDYHLWNVKHTVIYVGDVLILANTRVEPQPRQSMRWIDVSTPFILGIARLALESSSYCNREAAYTVHADGLGWRWVVALAPSSQFQSSQTSIMSTDTDSRSDSLKLPRTFFRFDIC